VTSPTSVGRSTGLIVTEPVNKLDPVTLDIMREVVGQAFTYLKETVDVRFIESDLRYQQRFDAQQKAVGDALLAAEKAVNTALASADRAVVKAETAAEKRFEAVNEFRAVLSNQSATLMPRTEADSQFKSIKDKIEDLKARIDRGDGGRSSVKEFNTERNQSVGTIVGITGTITGSLAIVLVVISMIISHPSIPINPVSLVPSVVDNTKRVDELISRLDALQRSQYVSPGLLPNSH
jgi:hypothetical protein